MTDLDPRALEAAAEAAAAIRMIGTAGRLNDPDVSEFFRQRIRAEARAAVTAYLAEAYDDDAWERQYVYHAPDEHTEWPCAWPLGGHREDDNAAAIVAAMNSLESLLACAAQLEKLTEAASCIRHWHDAMADGSGMVVSAEHVRKLWDATEQARRALQALAEGGGS